MIHDVKQVTPAWLTRVLRERGCLAQGRVTAVQAQVTTPFGAVCAHLALSYSDDAPPAAPTRLFLKLDGPNTLAGDREVVFYNTIAAAMADPPVLPCYDAAYDAATRSCHLLMDDVSETHFMMEREAPSTQADAERMIDVLAEVHAYWWEHPRLEGIARVDQEFIQGREDERFPGFVDFMGDRLSVQRRRIYERVLASLPGLLARRLAAKALTLVHDDAHAWNFMLPRDAQKDRVYLVDWQQWGVSAGPHDVAYMLTLFWYPERRQRMEVELVMRYHARLQAHGVTGYDWDACWYDYRLFAIRNLLVPLWAWARNHWGFHRWTQMEKAMLAFQDLGCVELLESSKFTPQLKHAS
jgi:hypothetical protein